MAWQVCVRKYRKLLAIDADGNLASESGNPPWEIPDKASADAFVQQNQEDNVTDWLVVQVPMTLAQAEKALRQERNDQQTPVAELVEQVFRKPPLCGNDVMKFVRVLAGLPVDGSEILTG